SINSFSLSAMYPIRGIFIVTTPIDPVNGFAPKSPPPRFLNSRLSRRKRQHIDRASSGFMSELTKLEKYGIPYFAVTSHSKSIFGLSQSKSLVILYVG